MSAPVCPTRAEPVHLAGAVWRAFNLAPRQPEGSKSAATHDALAHQKPLQVAQISSIQAMKHMTQLAGEEVVFLGHAVQVCPDHAKFTSRCTYIAPSSYTVLHATIGVSDYLDRSRACLSRRKACTVDASRQQLVIR